MSKPAVYNLSVREGATFRTTIRWLDAKKRPIILTGATVVAQIRDKKDGALLHELTTTNGGLQVLPTLGQIKFFMSPAQTESFTFDRAVWDLKVTWADGDVSYPIEGKVTITRSVTE